MLKEKATERFKLNTRFSRLDEQRTTDRQTRSAVNQRFLNKVLLQVALDEHAEKRAVALSCIPASHAKNGRPTITRHRDHYTENTPVLFLVQMEANTECYDQAFSNWRPVATALWVLHVRSSQK